MARPPRETSMEPADFRAMRERVGASQEDVAKALGVAVRSVNRWECGVNPIPPDAAALVGGWLNEHKKAVAQAMMRMRTAREQHGGAAPQTVALTYYRSQQHFDEHGRDKGQYGRANAVSREVARMLEQKGMGVRFVYPDGTQAWIEEARK